jgi:ion channel-forming bestrophin family protein
VPAITPKIILAALVGVLAKLIDDAPDAKVYVDFSFTPFTALGVAISLFLGFHNNASYGRWWEARTLWGNQIIAVRDLARFLVGALQRHERKRTIPEKTDQVNDEDEEDPHDDEPDWRHQIMTLSIAQSHQLRYQLRPFCAMDQVSPLADRDRFLSATQKKHVDRKINGADAILVLMATIVGRQYQDGVIDSFVMIQLSQLIDRLCNIQTSCERIHNTSLPLAYSLLVHRTTFLFVFLAPFAIVDSMGWYTPVFTAMLAYTFFGLDELARQIQEPFRDEPHCLALSAMCRAVERDVSDIMGRPNIPPPLKPHRSILM